MQLQFLWEDVEESESRSAIVLFGVMVRRL